MIQVLVVAPGEAVRAGLKALLEADPGLAVAASEGGLMDLETLPPETDVLVCTAEADPRPDLEELLSEDLDPPPALLLLTGEAEDCRGLEKLPLRAWGALSLEASAEELVAAVRALHEGLLVGDRALIVPLLNGDSLSGEGEDELLDTLIEPLTPRETEVLQALSKGLANKQIAYQLGISAHTAKFHVSSIYAKLGAANRTEAVRIGIQLGLVTL